MGQSIKARLKNEPSPWIDGNTVTFAWKGKVAPKLVGDFTSWDAGVPLSMHMDEPGIWTLQISFPRDAYIEYAFNNRNGNVLDPNNPLKTSNGVGGYNNYFYMPEYLPTELSNKNRNIPHGTVSSYLVPTDGFITGKFRRVQFYQPPTKIPLPLLVVWDGQDYLNRLHLNHIIDNLIAQEKISPLALALIHNGGQKARMVEYSCSEATIYFIETKVLPLAKENLNLIDIQKDPGKFGVAGASMGGLMALYAGLRLPHIFGKVLSQSGAFSWGEFDTVVFNLIKRGNSPSLNVWMDVGLYDLPGLLESNRKMNKELQQAGFPVIFKEYSAGHNYPAWKNEIGRGLEYLYGKSS